MTAPALLAGLRALLVIEDVLEHDDLSELRQIARPVLDYLEPP